MTETPRDTNERTMFCFIPQSIATTLISPSAQYFSTFFLLTLATASVKIGVLLIISSPSFTLTFGEMNGATVLCKNKLNLYIDGKTYQVAGSKHFNAVKYLNLYHRGIDDGTESPMFLGL